MLYINVRVPVHVPGMLALPSNPSQLDPPSQDRSSHTASPVTPLSILPHAIPSTSDTWRVSLRPLTALSGTGKISCLARDGSRVSQDRKHTVTAACATDGAM